ncbi:MAG: transposase [Candidatus Bipolaricaulaceae bacterium]
MDDRKVNERILYALHTGCWWQGMPRRCGAYVTVWRRLYSWKEERVWERIWQTLLGTLDEQGRIEGTRAFLDGSFVPAKREARRSG